MGFKINKYDRCVANKNINGKQCTICWYVDDTKISHVDPQVVDSVLGLIESKFGKMTVSRGKMHNFVGMDLEFKENGTVEILMKEYIKECIEVFGERMRRVTTPAKSSLFEIKDKVEMSVERQEICQHIVAKLLYISKRARVDIDLVVSFMCTRVSMRTEEDWDKLRRLLNYLSGTIDMPRVIGANSMGTMETYVDVSYAVHHDMKGHTGGALTLGKGIIYGKATKQKMNTKSSTESELVGASDYILWIVWTKSSLEE